MTQQELTVKEAALVVPKGEEPVEEVAVAPRGRRRTKRRYPNTEAYVEVRRCHACHEKGHIANACMNYPKWNKATYAKYKAGLNHERRGCEAAASQIAVPAAMRAGAQLGTVNLRL